MAEQKKPDAKKVADAKQDPTATLDEFIQALQATLESVNSTFTNLTQKLQQAQSVTQQAEGQLSRPGALQFSYHFPPSSRFQEIFDARTFAYGIAQQKGPIAQELYSSQIKTLIEALSVKTSPVEQQLFGEIAHVAAKTEMAQGGLIDEYAAVLGARQKLMEVKQTQPGLFEGTPIFDRLITGFAQREARLTRDLSAMVINTLQQFAQGFQTVGKTYQSVIDADVALMGPDMGASGTPVYTKKRVDPGAMGRYIYGVIGQIEEIDQILSARQRRYAAVFDVQRKAQQVEYRIADLLSPLTSPELTQALQRRGVRLDTSRVFRSLNMVQEALNKAEEALRTHGPSSSEFIQAHRAYAAEVKKHKESMAQVMQEVSRIKPAELAKLPGGMELSTLMQRWQGLQQAQQVFAAGRLPLGTSLKLGPLADIGEALAGFTSMNLTNLQWALMFGFSGVMFQALNQIPMQSTYQTLMPFYSAAGGVTGLTPLYQEIASFGMQIPQYMADLAGRLTSMQALLGSRTAAQQAVQSAIQIAQVQPIQFPEAMEVLTAMSIYPSLRPYATSPQAQQQVVNAVQLLSMLAPEQGVGGALFAIREMLGGQFRSMQLRFNISPELLAGYAGVSFAEFKQMPGFEQVQVLNQALMSLFGGREILVRRGAQFDVQLRNISDAMINAVVVPLTSQMQPALAQFVGQLTRTTPEGAPATRFEESALAAILPEAQVRGISQLAEERAQRLLEYAPTRAQIEVRAAQALGVAPGQVSESQLRQFAVQEQRVAITQDLYGTVAGAISLIASGVNTALQATLGGGNIAGGIGGLLVQFAQGFLGQVVEAQKEIRVIQASDMPEDVKATRIRQVGLSLVEAFAKSLDEGVNNFQAVFSQRPVQRVVKQIQQSIEKIVMASFGPVAQGMMTGVARTAIAMPGALIGGPIANIFATGMGDISSTEALTQMAGLAGWWSVIRYGRQNLPRAAAAFTGFGLLQHAFSQAENQPFSTTLTEAVAGASIIASPTILGAIGSRIIEALDRFSQQQGNAMQRLMRYGAAIGGMGFIAHGAYTLAQPELNALQRWGSMAQIVGGGMMFVPHPIVQGAGFAVSALGVGLGYFGARQAAETTQAAQENVLGDPIARAIQDALISAQQRVAVFMRQYSVEERLGEDYAQRFQQQAIAATTAPVQGAQNVLEALQPIMREQTRGNEQAFRALSENLSRTLLPTTMKFLQQPQEAFVFEEGKPVKLKAEAELELKKGLTNLLPKADESTIEKLTQILEGRLVTQAQAVTAQREELTQTYTAGALSLVVGKAMEEAIYGKYRIEQIPTSMIQDWTRTAELQERIPTFVQQLTATGFTALGASQTAFKTLPMFGVFGIDESLDLWKSTSLRMARLTKMGAIDFGEWMRRPELFKWASMGLILAGEKPAEYFREPAISWFSKITEEMTKGEQTAGMLLAQPAQAAASSVSQLGQAATKAAQSLEQLAQQAAPKTTPAPQETKPTPQTTSGESPIKENLRAMSQDAKTVGGALWDALKRGGASGLKMLQSVLSPSEVYAGEIPEEEMQTINQALKASKAPTTKAVAEAAAAETETQSPFDVMMTRMAETFKRQYKAALQNFKERASQLEEEPTMDLFTSYIMGVKGRYADQGPLAVERIERAATITGLQMSKRELAEQTALVEGAFQPPEIPQTFYDESIAKQLFREAKERPRSPSTELPLPDTPLGWMGYALGAVPTKEIPYDEPFYRIQRQGENLAFTNISMSGPGITDIALQSRTAANIAYAQDMPLSAAEQLLQRIVTEEAGKVEDPMQALEPAVGRLIQLGALPNLSRQYVLRALEGMKAPESIEAIGRIKPPEMVTPAAAPRPTERREDAGIINAGVVNVYAR